MCRGFEENDCTNISKHSVLSHLRAAVCAGACNDSAARDTFVETAAGIGWDLCLYILDNPGTYPEIPRGGPFERLVRQTARQQAIASGVQFDLLEELSFVELEHNPKNSRVRAKCGI